MSNNLARGQEKLSIPLADYSKEQSCDDLQYQTGQNVNGQKRAADAVIYGTYPVSTGNAVASGSTQRKIKKVAHGARKNDVIQFTSGLSSGVAIQILSCPDADTMILAATSEFSIAVGDTFDVKRYISPQYASDGSLSVSTIPFPTQYNRKTGGVTTITSVLEDLDTPANSRALPVVLHGVDAANITITGNQLDISSSHVNDSIRLGDGTTLVNATLNNELKTHDTDILNIMTDAVSTNNVSTTPLAGGGTYTGTADDILQYETVKVLVIVDQNGTLNIEASIDGIDWTATQPYPITVSTAGVAEAFFFQAMKEARYFRIRYVNGATPQAVFKLHCILDRHVGVGEVQAIEQQMTAHTDALVTKGVIYGKTTGGGGGYVELKVTPSGALTADVAVAQLPTTLGQTTKAGSLSVVQASDQEFQQLAANSSTANLGIGGVFTGTSFDTQGFSSVSVLIASDVASAANGVLIEYSADGTNWDEATVGTYTPSTAPNAGQVFGGGIRARYLRVVYTNGAVAQTSFRLYTTLRRAPMIADLVDMETTLGFNTHGIVTKSVITGKTTAGSGAFVDVKVNPSGALTADVTSNGANIATETTLSAQNVLIGAVTETAPASDTASSGLNGRLQRIAQNITTLISKIPSALGQTTKAGSLSVTLASDQGTLPTAQQTASGTITNTQKSVGTTEVRATVAGTAPSATRKKLMLTPSSTNSGKIYIGATGLTTSTGMEIVGPDKFIFEYDASDYYLISDTAAQVVGIVEVV